MQKELEAITAKKESGEKLSKAEEEKLEKLTNDYNELTTKMIKAKETDDYNTTIAQRKANLKYLDDMTFKVKTSSVEANNMGGDKKDVLLNFGAMITGTFQYLDSALVARTFNIEFSVYVKMIMVEFDKLRETIVSTKNRDNFFQYLKYRAGASSFFKDFVLNLKEIDKEVERDTDQSLAARILNDMIRSSGFMTPKIIGDLNETRHYALVLDKGDVDILKRSENMDIQNKGNLNRLFEKLRILNLLVIDFLVFLFGFCLTFIALLLVL